MLKKFIFQTNINELNKYSILLIYLFFSLSVAVVSSIYCHLFINKFDIIDLNNQLVLKKLAFDYGPLTHNIFYNSEFSFVDSDGIVYYLKRLPMFPILIVSLAKISTNIFFIFIAKSLILYSTFFFCTLFTIKDINVKIFFLFLLFLPFLIPYNLHVSLNIYFADNIIVILLPCVFILLISKNLNKYYIISILLFFLYLTKNSVLFIIMFLPFLILILEKDKIKYKLLPLFATILAIITWGIYGKINTGKFPIGPSIITSNAKVFNEVVLNDEFKKYYPLKSVDLIPKKPTPKHLKNEWEVYNYFKVKNEEYFKKNLKNFLNDIPIKLKFIFFNIRKDAVYPINGEFKNPILFSHIFNRVIFNLAIILSFLILLKNFKSFNELKLHKTELYFLFIITLALVPNVVGWATSKHLVGIQVISMNYLLFKFNKYITKKKFINL